MTMKEFLYNTFLIIKLLLDTTIKVLNLEDFILNIKIAVLFNIDVKTAAEITTTISIISITITAISILIHLAKNNDR